MCLFDLFDVTKDQKSTRLEKQIQTRIEERNEEEIPIGVMVKNDGTIVI